MDIVTDIYNEGAIADSEEDIVEAQSTAVDTTIIPSGSIDITDKDDRAILVAIYRQQEQIGNQLNWLCENLAGVFGMVTAMGQNGGGIRGLMKVMKEMNQNG